MKNHHTATRGSGNVFADLGLPNPEEHLLKAQIVVLIGEAIRRQGLTQTAAGQRIGLVQPDVSKLLKGRFEGFSLERLLHFLQMLGHEVSISVKPPANENYDRGHLSLAEA